MRSTIALIALLVIAFGTQLHAAQFAHNAGPNGNTTSKAEQRTEISPIVVNDLRPTVGNDAKAIIEEYHKDNETRLADATVHLVLVTGALAIFTALLFGATVYLAYEARRTSERQANEMQESLKISQTVAHAATLSADAAVRIELPILRAVPEDLTSVDGPVPPKGPYAGTVINSVPTKYSAIGHITYNNYGRTPAFPIVFAAGWQVASRLPDIPVYTHSTGFNHAVVIRPESESPGSECMVEFHCGIELTDEEIAAIARETSWLWFYGSIRYRDFMNIERETRFCWRWANRNVDSPLYFFASDGEPPADYIRQA